MPTPKPVGKPVAPTPKPTQTNTQQSMPDIFNLGGGLMQVMSGPGQGPPIPDLLNNAMNAALGGAAPASQGNGQSNDDVAKQLTS